MAIYDLHRSTADPMSTRICNVMVSFVIRQIDARKARLTHRALARLSDHELWDIGLHRGDIPNVSNIR